MKKITILFIGFFLGACSVSKKYSIIPAKVSSIYRIKSIDSTENNYIIYAIEKGLTYKLVTKRQENPLNCSDRIKVGRRYRLNLLSVFGRKFTDGPQSDKYLRTAFFNGEDVNVDENENIVRDIYKIENATGLCMESKK